MAWLVLREQLRLPTLLAMLIAAVGIGLMFADGLVGGSWLGNLIALGPPVSFAITVVAWRANKGVDMVPATCLSGVVGLAVIYGTGILAWKEWWHFLLAFAAVGAICFYSHIRLQRQADTGADDAALLKQGRIGTIVQLVGMVLVVVGEKKKKARSHATRAKNNKANACESGDINSLNKDRFSIKS